MPQTVFTTKQKVELALESRRFGSEYIDIMPAVSEQEKDTAQTLLDLGLNDTLIAATMLKKTHIDIAAELGMKKIILFTAVSDIHLKKRLRTSRQANKDTCIEHAEYARHRGLSIAFAFEDAARADTKYIAEIVDDLGKLEFYMPCDTIGCLSPSQSTRFYSELAGRCHTPMGVHVHNDLGMATANTIIGLEAGARILSGTFTGIGERAGNAAIEEVCAALTYSTKLQVHADLKMLADICQKVQTYSNNPNQRHKAVTGANSFTHESGIHVDGILKDPKTYEAFDPQSVGMQRKILYGKKSGKKSIEYLIKKHKIPCKADTATALVKDISQRSRRSLTEAEAVSYIKASTHAQPTII